MNILHTSDLHTDVWRLRKKLEPFAADSSAFSPDLIIVTGDMIRHYSRWVHPSFDQVNEKIMQAKEWRYMVDAIEDLFHNVPIVAVPGNHDFCDYALPDIVAFDSTTPSVIDVGGIKIAGFTGIPYMEGTWRDELNGRSYKMVLEILEEVAQEAEILVTHAGPHRIMDRTVDNEYVGVYGMREVLERLPKLKLHCFGHIHEDHDVKLYGNIRYSNAATTVNKIVL